MPVNYTIVGDQDIEFGTDGVGYTAIGVIVSASRKLGGDKLEIKDREGNVYAVVYFNEKNECEIEAIFDAGVTIPDRGAAIDVCGVIDVLVDEVEHVWENEKERMLKIRGIKYSRISV
jgi:hypothetical protein